MKAFSDQKPPAGRLARRAKHYPSQDLIGEGRFFTTEEALTGAPVCVLGHQTALDLFSGDNPVGETIWVERTRCVVIGVLAELESSDVQNMYKSDPNKALMLPISTMIQTLYDEEPSIFMTVHVWDAGANR